MRYFQVLAFDPHSQMLFNFLCGEAQKTCEHGADIVRIRQYSQAKIRPDMQLTEKWVNGADG